MNKTFLILSPINSFQYISPKNINEQNLRKIYCKAFTHKKNGLPLNNFLR